jgi:ribose/xylose/arabinose/galactoside ABC-type transport system permease subunit
VATQTSANTNSQQSWLLALMRLREIGIVFFIVLLMVAVSIRSPAFLTVENFRDILLNISILAIVALAQAMVIITGGIDLSVSSTIGLVAMMTAFVVARLAGFPPWLALPLGMALGAVLGSVNGLLIARGGLPPIIATLGTLVNLPRAGLFLQRRHVDQRL